MRTNRIVNLILLSFLFFKGITIVSSEIQDLTDSNTYMPVAFITINHKNDDKTNLKKSTKLTENQENLNIISEPLSSSLLLLSLTTFALHRYRKKKNIKK